MTRMGINVVSEAKYRYFLTRWPLISHPTRVDWSCPFGKQPFLSSLVSQNHSIYIAHPYKGRLV